MNFLGFVVVNEQEEYLHDVFFRGSSFSISWSATPFFSKFFPDRSDAESVKRRLNRPGLFVLSVFEKSESLVVATNDRKKPKWLKSI